MKPVAHILWKVIVLPFYLRNAGWLLFVFIALFGVAQNPKQYHIQLMKSILLSPVTLAFVMLAWLLYGFKTTTFVLKSIKAPENIFLKHMQALALRRIALLLMSVQLILLAPIWMYAAITVAAGFYLGYFLSPILIILFMVLLLACSVWLCLRSLFGHGPGWQCPLLPITFPKQFFAILIWHSFYKGKMKLLGVKFASFTMLFIPLVWNAGHANLSDFVLFFQASVAAHALVAYDYVQFLESDFPLLRNMPVSRIRIFLLYVVAYIALLLPEAAILFYYVPTSGFEVHTLSLLIFFMGQLLFLGAIAYEKNLSPQEYSMAVAMVCICLLFILPLAAFCVLGCIMGIAGFVIFAMLYYKYEPVYVEEVILY